MRLLLIAGYDHPANQGGVSTFNRNLINIFKENLYTITYFTEKKKIYSNIYENLIEIYRIKYFYKRIDRKFLNFKIQKFLLNRKVKKINPEICIINNPKDLSALKNIKKKKILVQHMDYQTSLKLYFDNKKKKMQKIFNKEIDLFICLSEYDKQRFSIELGVNEEKFKVIRHISQIEILKEVKKKNKELIMIARLENFQKRFDLAIRAMKKLPDFILRIYGDGNIQVLKNIIEENKLTNVFLYGATNNVKEKLDMAGIFIMTSDYEGYPISTIEAMRRGLPIILRDTFDSAKDIVKNNGVLLEKEWNEDKFVEAVKNIYNDYEYYSENSKELGKRYDFSKIKDEWKKIIELEGIK